MGSSHALVKKKKKKNSFAFHNNYYKISNIINTNISFRFLIIKVFFFANLTKF